MDALKALEYIKMKRVVVTLFLFAANLLCAQDRLYTSLDLRQDINILGNNLNNWSHTDLNVVEDFVEGNMFESDKIFDSIRILSVRSEWHYYSQDYAKNIHAKLKLISHYSNYIEDEYLEALNRKLAETYMSTGNFKLAQEFFYDCLNFSNEKVESYVYSQIGSTFISLGEHDKAIENYEKAGDLASNSFERMSHLNSIGFINYLKNDYEAALTCYDNAEANFNDSLGYIQMLILQSNRFSVYHAQGERNKCEELIRFFENSSEFNSEGYWFLYEVYSKVIKFYLSENNYLKASGYLEKLRNSQEVELTLKQELNFLKLKKGVELLGGKSIAARKTIESIDEVQKQLDLLRTKQSGVIEDIQRSVYLDQVALIESNQEILKVSNKRLQRVFIISTILFIVVTAFVFIWVRQKRNRQKRKEAYLALKSDYIEEQEKITSLKADIKSEEIKNKQLELNQMLNSINKHSSISNEVVQRLKAIKNKEGDVRDDLTQLLTFVNATNKSNELMAALEKNTDATYFGFKEKVESNYRNLTESELQLILLIRLGLKSKEIAQIRNVEPTSVRIYKHRLKTKMKLSKETDLTDFIMSY